MESILCNLRMNCLDFHIFARKEIPWILCANIQNTEIDYRKQGWSNRFYTKAFYVEFQMDGVLPAILSYLVKTKIS